MPMTVPVQRGGAKSLPAELKVGGHNPVMRMRASSPGYPRPRLSAYHRALAGLGCDPTEDPTCLDLGQVPVDLTPVTLPTDLPTVDLSTISSEIPVSLIGSLPTGYTGPTVVSASATPPAAPSGYQWATMLNSTGQTLAKVLAISQGGSSVQLPNGAQLVYGSPASAAAGSASGLFTAQTGVGGLSIGTLALLAIGGVLLFSMAKGGR